MNQNYPEYILKKMRYYNDLEPTDTSMDAEFQQIEPEEAFDIILKQEGIIGYRYTILRWISDIFKVKLDIEGKDQSKDAFVHGLGNIFRAQNRDDEVVAMRMDDEGNVIVFFKDGSSRSTSLGDKAGILSEADVAIF